MSGEAPHVQPIATAEATANMINLIDGSVVSFGWAPATAELVIV